MRSVGKWLLFVALAGYVFAGAGVGQPSVHPFHDGVATRDSGTVWHSLTWNVKDQKYFLPVAALSRNEGPLQFLLLNLYEYSIGNLLPLNPRAMQLPNAVFAALCIFLVYGFGRKLHSPRFGLLSTLTLMFTPCVVIAILLPWIINLLSVLAELLVLWLFVGLAQEPEKRLYRVGAPLSVAKAVKGRRCLTENRTSISDLLSAAR
jgi:Dolichyl-phosphate-mannose-protein mannosyltransferase